MALSFIIRQDTENLDLRFVTYFEQVKIEWKLKSYQFKKK
jgi:hypothetical protein